jgi:hypothetical protein
LYDRPLCPYCENRRQAVMERISWWAGERHVGWDYDVTVEGLEPGVEVKLAVALQRSGGCSLGPYSEPIVVTPGKGSWQLTVDGPTPTALQ